MACSLNNYPASNFIFLYSCRFLTIALSSALTLFKIMAPACNCFGELRLDALFSRHPGEGGCDGPGGRHGAEMLVSMAWEPHLGDVDQEFQHRARCRLQSAAWSGTLPPLRGQGKVPEEDATGREHLLEERHSPGYRPLRVLHPGLPSRVLDHHCTCGRSR